MFIKVTNSGGRRYAQLVESYRNDAGQPRQRTLATLLQIAQAESRGAIAAAEPENAMPLFHGVRPLLDSLHAAPGTLLGIATGKGRASLDRALDDGQRRVVDAEDDRHDGPFPAREEVIP